MTQEQYIKAVEINQRMIEIGGAKEALKDVNVKLAFITKNNKDHRCIDNTLSTAVSQILDRHDRMIRAEIDEEIKKFEKEIEEL